MSEYVPNVPTDVLAALNGPRYGYIGQADASGAGMVAIVGTQLGKAEAVLLHAKYCDGECERNEYLNEWLGVERAVAPVWTRPALS